MRLKIKNKVPLIDQHDKNFMYGGKFGGNFIPETLKKPIDDLTKLFAKLRKDTNFIKARDHHFKTYVGAPTPFIKLENLTDHLGGAQIYAKVVSEANGGAHKIYNATAGSQTLVDAVSECMRYWVSNCDTTHMCVGSTVGPNIFIKICAWSTAQISRELIKQVKEEFGRIPNKLKLINCVGGGSSAAGFWNEFMDTNAQFIGVEAGGPSNSKLHAAPLTNGSKIGILHGAAQYVIQDKEGQIGSTESISAGLDYPGISPLHCFLKDTKRAKYTSASDEEALKLAPKLNSSEIIIVNSCGDSLKDKDIIKQKLGSYIR